MFYFYVFTEKLFSCQICHRSYSNKYSLNHHMKVHDESKSFKCDVCWKLLGNKSSLEAHYRTLQEKNLMFVKYVIESLL